MKISKRKLGILFIFVIILIQMILLMTYQTVVIGASRRSIEQAVNNEVVQLTQEEAETLDLINEYRRQNGLDNLRVYSKLQDVAKLKAMDLVGNNYFSHISERLGTPFEMLESNGVDYVVAGENLAGNTTSERAVEAWINSPSHRENILDAKFEYTGLCVIDSPKYGKVYVQLFVGV